MNRLYVLSRISLKYWMQHKKRFFTFMVIVMLGAMALFSSALLIRSEKQAVLDEEFTLLGDYDTIFYNISDADVARIIQDHSVTAYGSYTSIGYVMSQENTRVGVGCFPDAKSCNMYHMSCTEGRYPRKQNEIAIDISKAKELGVYPHPGEKVDLSLYSSDKEAIVHKEFVISGIFDAENEYNLGTWERYPLQLDQGNVEIPGAFISRDYARYASDNSSTLFIQMNGTDPEKAAEKFRSMVSDDKTVIDVPFGRKYAYSYILGTSGSGKSTLMHIIGELDKPTSGEVYVDDAALNGMNDKALSKIRREKIGFVFQKFCLVQELKVIENIVLPTLLSDRKPDMEYIDRLCETLGIANRRDHYPSELSGGQQQRVAIARALSNNPDIILCDEPTGNLDKNTSQEVIDLLCGINHEYGKTLLIVTHDPDIAAKADRQIRIEDGKLYE